jgi:microcystin-dependent protein
MYATTTAGATPFNASAQTVGQAGGSQPHENTMPTLTVQFCIALFGIFPSQA